MPLTITNHLSDLPDPTTGLVYMGSGRWFDTFTGHALQPSLGGTLPHLPQSLNRYTTIATGQTGTQFTNQVSIASFVGGAFLANSQSTLAGCID